MGGLAFAFLMSVVACLLLSLFVSYLAARRFGERAFLLMLLVLPAVVVFRWSEGMGTHVLSVSYIGEVLELSFLFALPLFAGSAAGLRNRLGNSR